MTFPICLESHVKECSCIKDAQNVILKENEDFVVDRKIEDALEKLIDLNYIMLEGETQRHDAKFFSGRLSGLLLIKQLLTKNKLK